MPISIGLVTDENHAFYGEFTDYDMNLVDEKTKINVIDNLKHKGNNYFEKKPYVCEISATTDLIKGNLDIWLREQRNFATNEKLQFFMDCYTYDWKILLDLIMEKPGFDFPDFINYIPIDLSTYLWAFGVNPEINRVAFARTTGYVNVKEGTALFDACVLKNCFNLIKQQEIKSTGSHVNVLYM
jgi:hypothetical protein